MEDAYPQGFYDRLTKANDAIKFIKEIEAIELSHVTDLELEKLIDERFPIFPFIGAIIPQNTELFRARININEKPFERVEDIYLPPKEKLITYGRANRPYNQVFYCASNYELAIFEVIQNLKYNYNPQWQVVFLTVGVWKTKVALHVASIIHSPILHEVRKDIKQYFEQNQKDLSNGHMRTDAVNAYNFISQFFADQYTKSEIKSHFDYRISALYAHRLKLANSDIAPQYSADKFDGINYPSVAMKFKGDNQALFIEAANEKIELINTLQIVCSNFDFNNGTILSGVLLEADRIENNLITWKTEFYTPK
jgi:hypothetical protein